MRRWQLVTVVYAAFLLGWEMYGRRAESEPGAVLIPPSTILQTILESREVLLQNAMTTLTESLAGLVAGVVAALLIAVVVDRFRVAGEGVYRFAMMVHAIPVIALAAPIVAWLGLGFASKVVIAATAAYFPVLVNVTTSLRTLDPRVGEMGRILAMGYAAQLVRLRAPAVLPSFLASLKIAGPAAFIGAVVAEWMGAEAGLGVALMNAMFGFQIPQLWAVLVVASMLNGAIVLAATLVSRYTVSWQEVEG